MKASKAKQTETQNQAMHVALTGQYMEDLTHVLMFMTHQYDSMPVYNSVYIYNKQ